MKKNIWLLLAIFLLVGFVLIPTAAFAEETTDNSYKNTEIYKFVDNFIKENPSRSGAHNEQKAAEWLVGKFNEILPDSCKAEIVAIGSGNDVVSYNVTAMLTATQATEKQIIIGAHYDSVGEGANDNAAGVASLYFVMQNLVAQRSQLPVNVVFVCFGAEEQQLTGSHSYVDKMSAGERNNTLVMFNMDSIASGDNLYLFCENKSTDLANLILNNAKGASSLTEKPYAQGLYPLDLLGFGYYEHIQNSDQTPFRLAEIPTALFFSGNYVAWDYVESANPENNTMNTPSDTLANLDKNCGAEFVNKIDTVVQTLTATVLDGNFLTVAENARTQLLNNGLYFNIMWAKLAVLAVVVVLVVLAWLHYRKLQKQSIMGNAEIKNQKVFSTPDAEDIFSFDDSNPSVDDVFTYKK